MFCEAVRARKKSVHPSNSALFPGRKCSRFGFALCYCFAENTHVCCRTIRRSKSRSKCKSSSLEAFLDRCKTERKARRFLIILNRYVILEDDLVDSCKAGDDVTVGGVVVRRWRSFPKDEKPVVDIVFVANNVMQSKEEKVWW